MFPSVMGVVMAACFLMSNAAEQNGALQPLRFYLSRRALEIESPEFKKLKENEIKRVKNNTAIFELFSQKQISVQALKDMLMADAAHTDTSIELFRQFREKKGATKSPKHGSGYKDVESIFKVVSEQQAERELEVRKLQRTVWDCICREKPLPVKEVSNLLKQLQKDRLGLFAHFKIDAHLKEEMCTSYHMSAFPHLLVLDAQYHDLQQNILNCF